MRKKRLGLRQLAGLSILVAATAALTLSLAGSAFATDLHQTPPISNIGYSQDCSGVTLAPGQVLWHFVLVQTTAVNTATLTTTFQTQNGGVPFTTSMDKFVGGVIHWNVITDQNDLLLAASTDAVGALLNLSHVCGGTGGGGDQTSSITTTVHSGATDSGTPVVVDDGVNAVALGSTVHDSASLVFSGGAPLATGSTVFFSFFHNNTCDGLAADSASVDVSGQSSTVSVDPALAEGPLGAGEYSYMAVFVSGDTVIPDALGACEPFKVNKGDLQIRTDIHNAAHVVVTSVQAGSIVHDTATLSGALVGFNPDLSQVSFTFFTNSTCAPTGTSVANGTAESTYVARSVDSAALAVGQYSYLASFAGDGNYNAAGPAVCEPLTVYQLGLTMGFWGNKNGIARIIAAGGYATNSVTIGRGAVIDTQAESAKILPNSLNACGKGNPVIFTGQTTSSACTLATGVNMASLNTLAAQTLALGYNIKLVSAYTGQSIGSLSCVPVGSLTLSNTVNDAFTAAVALINGSASGGTTTQSQIGAMNTLLGCLNREA